MSTDRAFNKNRYIDLSRMAYEKGIYTYTDFLSLAELSDMHGCSREFYVNHKEFGGYEGAERCMVSFGSLEELGYEQDFPIACIKIEPLMKKFAEDLNHRDYLGSLMNLGIERSKMGDIVVTDKSAYVFVVDSLIDIICKDLTRVRHTSVRASVVDDVNELPTPKLKEISIQIHSERIDAIVAKVFNLSRSQSAELFLGQKIYVDGRLNENESHILKEESIVSVRGYGRFKYHGTNGTTRKGNLYAVVDMYV